jgi:hypothetical protein
MEARYAEKCPSDESIIKWCAMIRGNNDLVLNICG